MNATSIAAVLSLAQTLLPLIAAGVSTAYADIKVLLADVADSSAATPDQVAAAQALDQQSDAAQDAAYAAYEAARQAAAAKADPGPPTT